MQQKTAKKLWLVITIIGVIAMIFFTVMPAFQ